MITEFFEDALADDLRELFAGQVFPCSAGGERQINVYVQDLPIIEGFDEAPRDNEIPEPYIIVRTSEGKTEKPTSAQEISVILIVCAYDNAPNRQGHRYVLHIMREILARYMRNPLVRIKPGSSGTCGGPWSFLCPAKWATQQDDTHPYYFGAMQLKFEAPAVRSEVSDLI